MSWGRNLRAGMAIFRISLMEGLQYRIAALSGAAVSVFYGLIEIIVLTVFFTFGQKTGMGTAMSLAQAVSYIWLAQVIMNLQMSVDGSIVAKIESGDMGVELCRPLSLYTNWFFHGVGKRLAALVCRGLPTLLVGLLMPLAFRLSAPVSLLGLACALLAMVSACVLTAAWMSLVCVLRMQVQWGNGPMHMLIMLGQLLSGVALPLQLWPDFLQPFLLLQPFAGALDLPARLYLGLIPPSGALWVIALQLFWGASFMGMGIWLMKRRLQKIVLQGG